MKTFLLFLIPYVFNDCILAGILRDTSNNPCITDCKDSNGDNLLDGDYQSCSSCNLYASCISGFFVDGRECSGDLEWDDSQKECVGKSTTCVTATRDVNVGQCLTSCINVADGDYQSCDGCEYYVTCSNQKIDLKRNCPNGLEWDDSKKQCDMISSTCSMPIPDPSPNNDTICVEDCQDSNDDDIPDGDYQSCLSCNVYASCVGGFFIDGRNCPDDLEWDDNEKACVGKSTTRVTPTRDIVVGECITDCIHVADGDYQSCAGCGYYVTCSNQKFDLRSCPPGLEWDDKIKRCEYYSATCPGK